MQQRWLIEMHWPWISTDAPHRSNRGLDVSWYEDASPSEGAYTEFSRIDFQCAAK